MKGFFRYLDLDAGSEIIREETREIDEGSGDELVKEVHSSAQKVTLEDGSVHCAIMGAKCTEAEFDAYVADAGEVIDDTTTLRHQQNQQFMEQQDAISAVYREEQRSLRAMIPILIQLAEAAGIPAADETHDLYHLKQRFSSIQEKAPLIRK